MASFTLVVTLDQEFGADAGTAIHTYILSKLRDRIHRRYPLGPGKLSLRASRDLVWVAVLVRVSSRLPRAGRDHADA